MNLFLSSTRAAFFMLLFFIRGAFAAAAPATLQTPSSQPGMSGGGDSFLISATSDGRFILFASSANNLAQTTNNIPFTAPFPPCLNAFVRDRTNQITTQVSVSVDGSAGGNVHSVPVAISTNGQFVLFESASDNLVSSDTNKSTDIFVRDLSNNVTILVSAATNGACASTNCHSSAMTPDGRYVAFTSSSSNLVAGDTNEIDDVFVRDLQTGITVLASPGVSKTTNITSAVNGSDAPLITPDGHYVVFLTLTNVYGTSATGVVTLRDLWANTSTTISSDAAAMMGGTPVFWNLAMSDDDRYIAFEGNYFPTASSKANVFRYDVITGVTSVVTTNAVQPPTSVDYANFQSLNLTPDGRFVTYLGKPGTNVYIWDANSGSNTLVSVNLAGSGSNNVCEFPQTDPSGRYVVFYASSSNLVSSNLNNGFNLFIRDLQSNTTKLVDPNSDGSDIIGYSGAIVGSQTGQLFVAFDTIANNLVPGDENVSYDVILRDVAALTNELISVRHPLLPTQTAQDLMPSLVDYSASATGRYLALRTSLPSRNVYVRDTFTGSNVLATVGLSGLPLTNGVQNWLLSGDGRRLFYDSPASNIVSGDTNKVSDVFVSDLQNNTTARASVGTNSFGTNGCFLVAISSDANRVLFTNKSSALFLRDLNSNVTYTIVPTNLKSVAATPDLRFIATSVSNSFRIWDSQLAHFFYTNTSVSNTLIAISPDGRRIAYSQNPNLGIVDIQANSNRVFGTVTNFERPSFQFSGDDRFLVYRTTTPQLAMDTNKLSDVYLYDYQTGSNLLISQNFAPGIVGDQASDYPVISPDGRFVMYQSAADNLVPTSTNGVKNILLYDRFNGSTTLMSQTPSQNQGGNGLSHAARFSADGQTIIFLSWATDMAANDFNEGEDVFTIKLYGPDPSSVLVGQLLFAPGSGQGPSIVWPAVSGKSYIVQYKNNLSDAYWQTLNGQATVVGNQGSATDLSPNATGRFYRVTAF